MKRIDEYVNFIYKHVSGDKEEIEELKEEMRNHLIECAEELKSEGKSEKQAVQMAIERFGGEKVKGSVIGEIFNTQKLFSKIVLIVGVAMLLLSIVLGEVIALAGNKAIEEDGEIHAEVLSILDDQETITDDQKEVLDSMLAETQYTTAYKYYYISDLEVESFDHDLVEAHVEHNAPVYHYENKELLEKTLFMEIGTTTESAGNSHIENEIIKNSPLSNMVVLVGMVIYWILFNIWGIITLYQRNHLKVGWVILVVTLNVVGYVLYLQWDKNSREPS
ncbi:hypothetical protein CR194_09635 [Salipaludibacillus keqinensis]|uniref:Uncharacterized protein n=1 Tax=Salipaludibacillus keqinensis TaxID=2045207 RepID=A0A323TIN3_9BACI|nr:permease prefix domain 1-containing protein [Salipaludibacillus keqinensis]PYZ93427.1 hypothetical protein CR194_09635 [Salipaludibacillus keqinensis]